MPASPLAGSPACLLLSATLAAAQVTSLGVTNLGPADATKDLDVAYDDKHDVFLQVWVHNDAVVGRFVGFDGVVKGERFPIAPSAAFATYRPTVAYSRGAPDDVFMVTYASQSSLEYPQRLGQLVRFTGTGATGGTLVGDAFTLQGPGALPPAGGGRVPVLFNPLTRLFVTGGGSYYPGVLWFQHFTADGTPLGAPSSVLLQGSHTSIDVTLNWMRNQYRVIADDVYFSNSGRTTFTFGQGLDGSSLPPIDAVSRVAAAWWQQTRLAYSPEMDESLYAWEDTLIESPNPPYPPWTVGHRRVMVTVGQTATPLMDTDGDNWSPSLGYSAECRCVLLVSAAASVRKGAADQLQARLLDGTGQPTSAVFRLSTSTTTSGSFQPVVRETRGGHFVVSYVTDAGAMLERFAAPLAPAPGPRFSNVRSSADGPRHGASLAGPFYFGGWAVDFGAAGIEGSGIDTVHVWAFPAGGGSPIFVGDDHVFHARPDLASIYGAQFGNAGFDVLVSGLPDGTYTLVSYPHSTVSGAFRFGNAVTVTIGPNPAMALDGPQDNSTVPQPFLAGGWAVDRSAPAGSGVDAIHVWAFPVIDGGVDAANARFVAQGTSGGSRPDVGAVYGDQFTNSGYTFAIGGLPAGEYILGVYARSTVSGTFNQVKFVRITVPQ